MPNWSSHSDINGVVKWNMVLCCQHPAGCTVETALESVCRQLRSESIPILWATNTFHLCEEDLTKRARTGDPRARLVRRVQISTVRDVYRDAYTGQTMLIRQLKRVLGHLRKLPQLKHVCVAVRDSDLQDTTEDAVLHEVRQACEPKREGQVIDFTLRNLSRS